MNTTRVGTAVAVAFMLSAGAATAGPITGPVKPERAPPAQQSAPAEKVAPPMNAGSRKPAETTGQNTPDKLKLEGASNKPQSDGDGTRAMPQNDGATDHGTNRPDGNSSQMK